MAGFNPMPAPPPGAGPGQHHDGLPLITSDMDAFMAFDETLL